MSTFIVRIELHPSDKEQAYSAVHDAMDAAGFSRMYRAPEGIRYHLPSSEYCITTAGTAASIRDVASGAVSKVTTPFMLLVSDTKEIAVAGLVPVRESSVSAAPNPSSLAPGAEQRETGKLLEPAR